jgi:hypothetical protein
MVSKRCILKFIGIPQSCTKRKKMYKFDTHDITNFLNAHFVGFRYTHLSVKRSREPQIQPNCFMIPKISRTSSFMSQSVKAPRCTCHLHLPIIVCHFTGSCFSIKNEIWTKGDCTQCKCRGMSLMYVICKAHNLLHNLPNLRCRKNRYYFKPFIAESSIEKWHI